MFEVKKVSGAYAVVNWNDEIIVAYRNKKHADQSAKGATCQVFNAAEIENERRDMIAAYLASRALRPVRIAAQFELF